MKYLSEKKKRPAISAALLLLFMGVAFFAFARTGDTSSGFGANLSQDNQPARDTIVRQQPANSGRTERKTSVSATPYSLTAEDVELPDNISKADCFGPSPSFIWDVAKEKESDISSQSMTLQSYANILVGDLTGDGVPELVTLNCAFQDFPDYSNAILIFNNDLTLQNSITVPSSETYVTLPLALGDVDSDGVPEIIYGTGENTGNDGADMYRLMAYHADGTLVWKSTQPYMASTSGFRHSSSISIADLDGDGNVEIFAGDRIFDGNTGNLLATLPTTLAITNPVNMSVDGVPTNGLGMQHNPAKTGMNGYLPAIGDVDGDGILELACGNTTYKVTITNRSNTANPVTIVGQIDMVDGYTSLADIDGDGSADVVVVGRPNTDNESQMYVWSGVGTSGGNQIGQTVLGYSYGPGAPTGKNGSRPFIGDIDADGKPEIAYSSYYLLGIFSYNTSTKQFYLRYYTTTTDASAATTLSLFDFNLDGRSELVYRDETLLRIMQFSDNGAGGFTSTENTFSCLSGTHTEYPTIADIDNDGHAEIVVSGADVNNMPYGSNVNNNIRVMAFGSPSNSWAPARKVWNQHGYNAINVNNDLTIPRHQFNPTTAFAGSDGVMGTTDDVRPFNNFMQQQTLLNKDGYPVWPMPDIAWNGAFDPSADYLYYNEGDSLTITSHVVNTGDASLIAPVYFSVYKDAISTANLLATGTYTQNILAGDTAVARVNIKDFLKNYSAANNIVVRLNDDGTTFPKQDVCNDDAVTIEIPKLIAIADNATTLKNNPINIAVLNNDELNDCTSPVITISSPSANGTATVDGEKITFTPNTDYVGTATFSYRINCDGRMAQAVVTVNVVEKPDNISDADCFVTPPSQQWSFQEIRSTAEDLSPYISTMVGDVDGDGIPEILASKDPVEGTVNGISRPSSGIAIFKGNDITVPWKTITTVQPYSWDQMTKFGIVKTKIAAKDSVLIVVAESDRYLRAYNYNGELIWTSSTVYHSNPASAGYNGSAPGFADFNKDGIPEVMVKGKIFNSTNGQLLCATPTDPSFTRCVPIAADLFNTGTLNFIVGNSIYTPNASLTALTLVRTITLTINPADPDIPPALGVRPALPNGGYVSAVDMDKDGKLELIYQMYRSGLAEPYVGESEICVVDPSTGAIKASKYIAYAPSCSWPFVGDIDGCGTPEIVFITSRRNVAPPNATEAPYWNMHAYKFVPGNPLLQKFWTYPIVDPSGVTGMTLFDFNQDGISEIVYRDEQDLRIINGSLKDHQTGLPVSAPYNLTDISGNTSGTSAEYPVVADVNADGQAEIVIVSGTTPRATMGSLRVYKSSNQYPWAPARKVWNQYAYNVVNVNEDLTVPKNQLSPAIVFPGEDGILGTPDDVRPYNNFFQQQTTLSKWGTPLWLAPNGVVVGTPVFSYNETSEEMNITVQVANIGEITFQKPFHVTAYKDDVNSDTKYTYSYDETIAAGDTVAISFTIPDFSEWMPNKSILIRINDKGDGLDDQIVCNDTRVQYNYFGITPTEQIVCPDYVEQFNCMFTVSDNGTDTYQWQTSQNNTDWTDIKGATTNTYKPEGDGQQPGVTYYRIVVTSGTDATKVVESVSAKTTVNPCFLPVNPHIRGRLK